MGGSPKSLIGIGLRTEKCGDDPETTKWRRQFFAWWIKWEECDSGNLTRPWRYLVVGYEGWIGLSRKLLRLC